MLLRDVLETSCVCYDSHLLSKLAEPHQREVTAAHEQDLRSLEQKTTTTTTTKTEQNKTKQNKTTYPLIRLQHHLRNLLGKKYHKMNLAFLIKTVSLLLFFFKLFSFDAAILLRILAT